jgi:hypothetical protein
MSKGDVHTVPHDQGWANEREGASQASSVHPTKEQAVEAGRTTAKREHVEHLIHNKDGEIGERNTYKQDSFPPKG